MPNFYKLGFLSILTRSKYLSLFPSSHCGTHACRRWAQWQRRTACGSCRRWWSCPVSSRRSSCRPEPFRSSPIRSSAGLCWPPARHSLARICPKAPQGWVALKHPPPRNVDTLFVRLLALWRSSFVLCNNSRLLVAGTWLRDCGWTLQWLHWDHQRGVRPGPHCSASAGTVYVCREGQTHPEGRRHRRHRHWWVQTAGDTRWKTADSMAALSDYPEDRRSSRVLRTTVMSG